MDFDNQDHGKFQTGVGTSDNAERPVELGDRVSSRGSANLQADGGPSASTGRGTALVLAPNADNVIILPPGVELDAISIQGRDLVVVGEDGTRYVIPDGAIVVPQLVVDGVSVPPLNLAALLIGQEPQPAAGNPQSSGGNFADPVGDIQSAYDLGNLLPYTELQFPEPQQEEIIPGLIDREPDVIVITPDQPAGAESATAVVNEAALGAPHNPTGTNPASDAETTTGTIDYTSPDGLASLTINGVAVTAVGQTLTTPYGVLTITSIDPGSIGYSYTLTDNTLSQTIADVFAITVTDIDGDTANASLSITVIDDAPVANADTDTVAAGTYGPESGNVMTGAGTTSGAAGADIQGADGAAVSGVSGAGGNGVAQSNGTFVVQGTYGTLTIAPDGSYDYVRAPGTPGGVTDTFSYTLTDGDGSADSASLVITIGDSPASVTTLPTTGSGAIVDESGLLARPGEAPGSDAGSGANQTTGTIGVTAPDGIASVEINGVIVTGPGQTIDTEHGVLTIVDYDSTTGEIDYQYALTDNTTGDTTSDTVTVKVTDTDGDSDQKPFEIHIIDDVPTANSDSATQGTPGDAVTVNVLANDVQGADSVQAGTVAYVDGTLSGTGTLVNNSDGTFTYAPADGENGSITFDYTITDGDGDVSTATVTIDVVDRPTGLDVPTAGDAGTQVDEGALATGSNPASPAEQTSGQITFSAPDGVQSLTIDGQPVVAGQSYTGSYGTLTVTAVSGSTIDYTYLLTTNTDGDATSDSFVVKVTDVDGDSSTGDLMVAIIDDVPTAVDDTLVNVAEDAVGTVGGNVLTNDTRGADDASVVSVTIDGTVYTVDPTAGVTVTAGEGTYVINANGSWTFDPATGQDQSSGPVDASFEYTIEDGDGDQSSAMQPIRITDGAGPIAPSAASIMVDDQTLSDGSTPAATQPPSASATLAFTAGSDAIDSIVFGDTGTLDGGLSWTRVDDTTINGYDGGRLVVTLTLEVTGDTAKVITTLVDNYTHPTAGGDQTTGIGSATVVATDIDNDTATGTVAIAISDDLPTLAVTAPSAAALSVDETTLGASSGAIDFSGLFTPDYNADSNGTIGDYKLGISAEGADTGLVDTASGQAIVLHMNGTTVQGVTEADGDVVFEITVSASGTVELTQLRAIVHGDTTSDNESSVALDPALITLSATAIDGDGDPVTASAQIGGAITFLDDGPGVIGSNATAYLDDDALTNGIAGGTGDGPDGQDLTGTLVHDFGSDGGSIAFDTLTAAGFTMVSSVDGVSGHQIVSIEQVQNGVPVTVVTVDLDPATGDYSVSQVANVLHANGGNENDQSFTLGYTVTDGDNDTATGTLVITVNDDTPVAQADTETLTEDTVSASGNVLTNDGFGADGQNTTTPISAVHGDNLNVAGLVGGATQGEWGSLTLGSNGQYTYTLDQSKVQFLDDGESRTDTFTYTIVDADGDTSQTTLTVTVTGANDAPEANPDTNWVLDVTTGADPTTSGNVLQSIDHAGAPSGSFADQADTDVDGDTLSVTQVQHGASTVLAGAAIAGDYGSITIGANGGYTYTLDSDNTAVEALNAGETLTDTFTYTVTDGDVTTTETVTITIFGADSSPVVTGSAAAVSEEGLPGGLADDNPTTPADADTTDSASTSGAITIADVDSTTFTVALGAPTTTLHTADGVTALTWQVSPDGHTLIAYSTDASNPEVVVTIDNTGAYTVTLNAPVQHGDTTIEDTLSFDVPVTVTDSEGNPGNTVAITVTIEDDSPTAADYTGGSFAENSGVHDLGDATSLLQIAAGGDGLKDTLQDITFTPQGTPTGGTVTIDASGHLIYTAPASVTNTGGAAVTETFSYTVIDADGDSVTHTVTFQVSDTGISAVSATDLVADEDDIVGAGGNSGGPGDLAQTTSGTLNFTLGADVLQSIALSVDPAELAGMQKLDGTPVSTVWDAANSVLIGYGTDQSDVVFTITLTSTGTGSAQYDVVWEQPVLHPGHDNPATGPVETAFEDSITFAVDVLVIDADGSDGSTSFDVTINDDSPIIGVVGSDANTITATTHDSLTIGAASDVATANFSGAFTLGAAATGYGADGAGTTAWDYALTLQQAPGTNTGLTSDGQPIYLVSQGGTAIGSTSTDATDTSAWVFTIEVAPATGVVTLTQLAEIDHLPTDGAASGYDGQTVSLPTGLISLSGIATITDGDGDSVTSSASIDLGGNLLFADDGPHAIADTANVTEGGSVSGNVLLGNDGVAGTADDDTFGADGPVTTVPAGGVVGVAAGSSTATPITTGVGTPIAGNWGTLTLNADGSYTYTVAANTILADQVDTFVYTIADGDGDYSTVTLTIDVDAVTLTASDSSVIVYEKAMDGAVTGSDVASGGLGSDPGDPGETAAGSISVTGATSYTITAGATYVSTSGNLVTYQGQYGTLVLNSATGAYTYTLTAAFTTTPNANDGVTTALDAEDFTFLATDGNGNSDTGHVTVDIVDDIPLPYITPPETGTGINVGSGVESADFSLHLPYAGADQPGSLTFDVDNSNPPLAYDTSGGKLTFDGQDIYYTVSTTDPTVLEARTSATPGGGTLVFEIDLDPAAGTYTFTQFEQLSTATLVPITNLSSVGGGNVTAKAILNPGEFDLLLSTKTGFTINTNANQIGIGSGQSLSGTDAIRVDFLQNIGNDSGTGDLIWQEYYSANSYRQDVSTQNSNRYADFTVRAITVNEAPGSVPADPADGDSVFYGDANDATLAGTTINIYNASGTLVQASNYASLGIVVSQTSPGVWQILNLPTGYDFEIVSPNSFEAVEIQSLASTDSFKLGVIGVNALKVQGSEFSVPITLTDHDGDQVSSTITIDLASPTAPVVLDLNGDGVHFVGAEAGVLFDYSGDGSHEATAWASAEDGILAIDANGDGKVTSADEFVFGGKGLSDLEGLAARYDSNHDGVLDAADADFAKFGVWQDANQNGVSDPGEFASLTQLGIASIALTSDGKAYIAANGDVVVLGTGSFTRADGTLGDLADAVFATEARSQQRTAETITTAALAAAVLYPLEAAAHEVAPAHDHAQVAAGDFTVPAPVSLVDLVPHGAATLDFDAGNASLLEGVALPHMPQFDSNALHSPVEGASAALHAFGQVAAGSAATDTAADADAGPAAAFAGATVSLSLPDGSEGAMMDAILAMQGAQADNAAARGGANAAVLEGALSDFAGEAVVDTIVDHFTGGGPSAMSFAGEHTGPELLMEALDSHVFSGLAQFGAGVPDHVEDAAAAAAAAHA